MSHVMMVACYAKIRLYAEGLQAHTKKRTELNQMVVCASMQHIPYPQSAKRTDAARIICTLNALNTGVSVEIIFAAWVCIWWKTNISRGRLSE